MTGAGAAIGERAERIRRDLAARADPSRAVAQQRYMRSTMPFHGVAKPDVTAAVRQELRRVPCADRDEMLAFARLLWDEAAVREERYAALAVCGDPRNRTLQDARCLPTYRRFIVTGAWWDLVDETARLVGEVLDRDPAAVTPVIRRWAVDPDPWLRRTAIICQRHRAHRTDVDLLAAALEPNLADRDFFIRKAAGWALRQYGRTDPAWVRGFVATHELSGLTRREALKHLGDDASA